MTTYPEPLLEALDDGTLVPFVGAGVSVDSGVPAWRDLLTRIVDEIPEPHRQQLSSALGNGTLDSLDVPALHQALLGSRVRVHRLLEQTLNQPFRPNRLHDLLRQLECSTLITTNFDLLIERSYDAADIRHSVVWRDAQLKFFNEARSRQLVKVHGTISDPDSCVLSREQYEAWQAGNPLLFGLVQSLFAVRTILFLGCSLTDPHLTDLLELLFHHQGRLPREHFAIMFKPRPSDVAQLQRKGVTVVAIDGSAPGDATITWLEGLLGRSRRTWVGHVEKARAFNRALARLIRDAPPAPIVRMRASMGMISLPEHFQPGDLYDAGQDVEEAEMGRLLRALLKGRPNARYRTIVHVDPSLQMRKGLSRTSMGSRLRAMVAWLQDFPNQIEIAHSPVPIFVNHLIVHQDVSFLSHKRRTRHGPNAVRSTSNRWVIESEAHAFDEDFFALLDDDRSLAADLGIDTKEPTWSVRHAIAMIDGMLTAMAYERKVTRCDESGQAIELVSRAAAHLEGILHKSVHLHIVRRDTTGVRWLLLQRRSASTDLYPLLFDVAVAGHALTADSRHDALREAAEELGIWLSPDSMKSAWSYRRRHGFDNEFVDVFVADLGETEMDLGGHLSVDVDSLAWCDLDALEADKDVTIRRVIRLATAFVEVPGVAAPKEFVPGALDELAALRQLALQRSPGPAV
jgi:isopentenyldiphosphate isomerase